MEMGFTFDENDLVYEKTHCMSDAALTYCPGCGHGVIHRIAMEVIDEMGIEGETIGVASVGCSVFAYDFMNVDMTQAAHGRATAVATGIKRCWPDKFVFTYQGDGDLAAIGTAETIHTCNRGENILVIFVNNGIYGMTGGQMAPTTLLGMKSSTSPYGREANLNGNPIKMSDIVAQLQGSYYVTRQSVHTAANVRKAKKAIRQGFENQKKKLGTSFVEIISNCNQGWKMSPIEANKWMEDNMFPFYPLGDLKVDGKLIEKKA